MTTADFPDDLVPLQQTAEASGFDVVLRGYDRRQVDDYLDRVEVALTEADERHAQDGERITALEKQVAQVQQELADSARRASGQPEPASLLTARLAEMLRLAEQEAAAIRAEATAEAEGVVGVAKSQAARESSERDAALRKREQDVARAAETAESSTLQAQKDSEALRARAQTEADELRKAAEQEARTVRGDARTEAEKVVGQARQDVQVLHEQARQEAAAMTAEAGRQVEELSAQRNAIAGQLQNLRDAVSAAVAPLGGSPVQAGGGSVRVPPRD
ncbi:MAG: DivIVA domain-containing protein [Frankiaceae bacterium]|nr:DivIVA domain-containing protein [Frankiaceae bacterium]